MRLAVYTDYAYHRVGERVYAERAFALFLAALAGRIGHMVVVGRLSPESTKARYDLGDVEFMPLPFYETLANPFKASVGMIRSLGTLWRALENVDAIWLLGPHALALPIALMSLLRRRRLILGVRQEYVQYVRSRHPRRPGLHFIALILDSIFRLLARLCPVIVVGPRLAESYGHASNLLQTNVSLITDDDIVPIDQALARRPEGPTQVVSVGRLEAEKDPLLLADILSRLGQRWHLVICGEGPLEEELRLRLADLKLTSRVEIAGYVPHARLRQVYEASQAVVHVSLTEGVPQVLFEAFAAGVPIVASDVGGIRDAAPGAVLLFPPGDAASAAEHLDRLATDQTLRRSLIEAGHALARGHTLDGETRKVADFIER